MNLKAGANYGSKPSEKEIRKSWMQLSKQVNRLLTEHENRALARVRGDEPVSDFASGIRSLSKVDKLLGSD